MAVTLWDEFIPQATSRHTTLSGVEINQNQSPASSIIPTSITYQTFFLPSDYQRGGLTAPDITGLQICCVTNATFSANISLEVNEFGSWQSLTQGSVIGAHTEGQFVWIDIYFDAPIQVPTEWLERQFRLGVQSDSAVWTTTDDTMLFRVLTASADSGVDFLGNAYRSVVANNDVDAVNTVSTSRVNNFWLSKPNPSKFAVESLYFDVRDVNEADSVIDRVLLDPITPGVYMTLYYSSEGDPGVTQEDWDNKLWNPVYQTFQLIRRQEFALRDPITAKYIKMEFSHLQAQHYNAGTFHQPIRYKKHPKWVLEYFMTRMDDQLVTEDPFVANNVKVVYSSLNLAYDYYLDDLRNNPGGPVPTTEQINTFLGDQTDVSDQVDAKTMQKISTEMALYTKQPADRVRGVESALAAFVEATRDLTYPVEQINRATADTTPVSSLDRMSLVIENNMPIMFFYITARHKYRELEASFEEDRAYYVGIRELAFTRDHYTTASDTSLYIDALGDFKNVSRNDFLED